MSELKLKQDQLPEGWEVKKLGSIASVSSGNSAPQNKDLFKNGIFPFFRTSDVGKIKKGFISTSVDYLNDEGIKKLRLFKKGTILFPKSGASTFLNHRVMMLIDGYVASHLATIKADNILVDDRYLLYYLTMIDARDLMQDIAYPSLKISDIILISISLPSVSEQKRIVSILDKTFAEIEKAKSNAQQNLKNVGELFESYLQGVFEKKGEGWEEKTLGDVCKIRSKLIDPKKIDYQSLVHIGAGNIESMKGSLVDLKTAKEENLISGKFLFDESMVLYSKIRPYLMKVVNCSFKGLCSADIYPLSPAKDILNKDFLYHLLFSKDFTEYAILGSQRAGIPKVNRGHLFAYKFFLPPIEIQNQIVQKLDTLSAETKKLENIYQKKIVDLEEIKKSVLQKAFRGEL